MPIPVVPCMHGRTAEINTEAVRALTDRHIDEQTEYCNHLENEQRVNTVYGPQLEAQLYMSQLAI